MGKFTIMIAIAVAFCVNAAADEPSSVSLETTVQQMLAESNELRESVGLEPHQFSTELTAAAQDHAEYMAQTGEFSHYVNGGHWDRAKRHGYEGSTRENIAMGYITVEDAFAGWRSSSGHWATIVSGTTDAGFGYAVNEYGMAYWVGVYGYPTQTVGKPVIDGDQAADGSDSAIDVTYRTVRRNRLRILRR